MATQTLDIVSDIRMADDVFEKMYRQGDVDSLADLYTENATLLPTGSDFVKGKKAIRDFWQGVMNMGIKEIKLDITEAEQNGDIAFEVGEYKLKAGDGKLIDQGKYVVVWKQENGEWKLHRDIWNTSQAPPQS